MVDDIKAVYLRLPKKLWLQVAKINLETDEKMNNLIIRLLTEYLEKSAK